jgi:hypothetical protein
VELADLISQLRGELSRAMWAGEHGEIRFEPGPVVLELTVCVERNQSAEGKVRFWVLDASTGAARSSLVTQKMTVTLDPRLAARPDRRPLIAGEAEPGER